MSNVLDLPAGGLADDYSPISAPRLGADHPMTYAASGGAARTAGPLSATTHMIQIVTPSATVGSGVRWVLGTVAAGSTPIYLLPMGAVAYYRAYPGEYFSVVSDDGNTGYIDMTECASRPTP